MDCSVVWRNLVGNKRIRIYTLNPYKNMIYLLTRAIGLHLDYLCQFASRFRMRIYTNRPFYDRLAM